MDDDSALVRRVETVRRGVHPLLGTLRCRLGAVRLEQLLLALQDISLLTGAGPEMTASLASRCMVCYSDPTK